MNFYVSFLSSILVKKTDFDGGNTYEWFYTNLKGISQAGFIPLNLFTS